MNAFAFEVVRCERQTVQRGREREREIAKHCDLRDRGFPSRSLVR
jgi:hypothetical protein